MIGKTVTYNPEIINKINFDIGIIGEAENTLKTLLKSNINNTQELTKISGITFKNGNETIINKPTNYQFQIEN